jgi:hypothetical protein
MKHTQFWCWEQIVHVSLHSISAMLDKFTARYDSTGIHFESGLRTEEALAKLETCLRQVISECQAKSSAATRRQRLPYMARLVELQKNFRFSFNLWSPHVRCTPIGPCMHRVWCVHSPKRLLLPNIHLRITIHCIATHCAHHIIYRQWRYDTRASRDLRDYHSARIGRIERPTQLHTRMGTPHGTGAQGSTRCRLFEHVTQVVDCCQLSAVAHAVLGGYAFTVISGSFQQT